MSEVSPCLILQEEKRLQQPPGLLAPTRIQQAQQEKDEETPLSPSPSAAMIYSAAAAKQGSASFLRLLLRSLPSRIPRTKQKHFRGKNRMKRNGHPSLRALIYRPLPVTKLPPPSRPPEFARPEGNKGPTCRNLPLRHQEARGEFEPPEPHLRLTTLRTNSAESTSGTARERRATLSLARARAANALSLASPTQLCHFY